jgi:glycosyltransferase involved in cell wall biosynthesis
MKLTVITTCLNAEKYIKDTIESVLSQEGDFQLEYIITDAGSTDKTLEIIRSFGDKIRLIDAAGTNQSQGFNVGIDQSTGDVLSFLNADDIYLKGALQMVSEAVKANPEGKWFIGRYKIIDEKNNERDQYISEYKARLIKSFSYSALLIENFIPHPSTFIKKELFDKYGFFDPDEKYAMDYDLWLRIGKNHKPVFIDQKLATFKREPGTKSNANFVRQMFDDFRLGIKYSLKHLYLHTLIFKFFSFIRTIVIYKIIYR